MIFDKVFIIGSGSICINIIKSLLAKQIKIIAIMYKEHQLSPLSMFLKAKNVENYSFDNKEMLKEFLEKVNDESLIISANNIFLFPKSIVTKKNFKIINFHNALLPRHRGMNAPTWAIFEQDKITGITWHLVNEKIDDGDIIIQKSLELKGTETAIFLIKQLMNLAFNAYKEIEDDVLQWRFATTPMKKDIFQIHYSKDIPNNGILDTRWDKMKISAFLRSLDWGCVNQFKKPKIKIEGKLYEILTYNLSNPNDIIIKTKFNLIKL